MKRLRMGIVALPIDEASPIVALPLDEASPIAVLLKIGPTSHSLDKEHQTATLGWFSPDSMDTLWEWSAKHTQLDQWTCGEASKNDVPTTRHR